VHFELSSHLRVLNFAMRLRLAGMVNPRGSEDAASRGTARARWTKRFALQETRLRISSSGVEQTESF
jgi:hypothetical protein